MEKEVSYIFPVVNSEDLVYLFVCILSFLYCLKIKCVHSRNFNL